MILSPVVAAAPTQQRLCCWLVLIIVVLIIGYADQCEAHFVKASTDDNISRSADDLVVEVPTIPGNTHPRILGDLGVDVLELLTPTCSQNLLGSNLDYSINECGNNIGRKLEQDQSRMPPWQQGDDLMMMTHQNERALDSCGVASFDVEDWNCFAVDPSRKFCGCRDCYNVVCDDRLIPSSVAAIDPYFYIKQCCGQDLEVNDTITPGWTQDCVDRADKMCRDQLYPINPPCGNLYFGREALPSEFDLAFASADTECNDGGLTIAELTAFFNDILASNTVQQSDVTNLFNALDVDNDNYVDVDEFGALRGSVSRTFTFNVLNQYTINNPAPNVDSSNTACVAQTRAPTTFSPSQSPSVSPSGTPSQSPSAVPSNRPSIKPSDFPSQSPSLRPSRQPSTGPSEVPSESPSLRPSVQPSREPSQEPSSDPSQEPSQFLSKQTKSIKSSKSSSGDTEEELSDVFDAGKKARRKD